jgi:hypothetical protein
MLFKKTKKSYHNVSEDIASKIVTTFYFVGIPIHKKIEKYFRNGFSRSEFIYYIIGIPVYKYGKEKFLLNIGKKYGS